MQYAGPIPAPIAKGQKIAILVLDAPGVGKIEVPLLAGADVERKGFFGRLGSSARQLFGGNAN